MSDRTCIIVYEVYQAPCRFLNILYIHCTRATRGGGGWKPIRLKTNDLITYTDTEYSRNALLFISGLLSFGVVTLDDRRYTQCCVFNMHLSFSCYWVSPELPTYYEIKCTFAGNVFCLSFW